MNASCRSRLSSAALTACLLGSTAIAQADDAPANAESAQGVTVMLGDLEGQIVAVDDGFVTVVFPGSPGSSAKLATAAFSKDKLFAFRKANMQADDADAWVELADHAGSQDLHVRRIEALKIAVKRDPERKDELDEMITETCTVCGEESLKEAKELREAGDLDDAVAELETISGDLADCDAGKEAQKLLSEIRANLDQERTQAVTQQAMRKHIQEHDSDLTDAREVLAAGQKLVQEGLQNLDHLVKSKNAFEDALARFDRVRRELDEWSESKGHEEGMSRAIGEEHDRLKKLAKRRAVNAHIQLGFVYVARGDQQSALSHVGQAAALDPSSMQVSQLRQAIASSNRW